MGRGINVCSGCLGQKTKMAAMPIYGKNPSKNLLQKQKVYGLENFKVIQNNAKPNITHTDTHTPIIAC